MSKESVSSYSAESIPKDPDPPAGKGSNSRRFQLFSSPFKFLSIIFVFLLLLSFGFLAQKMARVAGSEKSFLGKVYQTGVRQSYVLEDNLAIARYKVKESVEGTFTAVRGFFGGKDSEEEGAEGVGEGFINVSESGVGGDEKVKGAVLGESGEDPVYMQYLPVPSISNFSTSVQTAGATVSYPIETPPGPGGIKPNVGLSYSSAKVDNLMQFIGTSKKHYFARQSGPAGLGWGISGGNHSISIDTHGEMGDMSTGADKSKWTVHLNFPGGSAELYRDNGEWHTDPELFVKFVEAPESVENYSGTWVIKTADGTKYTFVPGRSYPEPHCQPNDGCLGGCDWRVGEVNLSWDLSFVENSLGQKIEYSYEKFGGNMHIPSNTDGCSGGSDYIGRTAVKRIKYGPHEIAFIYGKSREDWRIIKETDFEEEDGKYVFNNQSGLGHHENNNAYASAADKALSEVLVKTNGNLVKKYKLNYYDNFTVRDEVVRDADVRGASVESDFGDDSSFEKDHILGTVWCGHCPKDANGNYIDCCPGEGMDPECKHFNGEGCYKIVEDENGGVDSCNDACEDAGYASGWCYKPNLCAHPLGSLGDYGCTTDADPQCCCSTSEPNASWGFMVYGVYNLNDNIKSYHLHLKSIQEFGKDGSTSLPAQTFTYQKIPYKVWWDGGETAGSNTVSDYALNSVYIKTANNGYGGKVTYDFENLQQPVQVCYSDGICLWDSKNQNIERTYGGKTRKVRYSLQRAKLKMTTTEDGAGEWWQKHYIYTDSELGGLGYMKEGPKQYEYLGYSSVEQVVGAKGADIARGFSYHPDKVESISKTFYHRILKGSNCVRKSPAAGLSHKSWVMDETGKVLSETLKNYKFNVGGSWAEQCTAYRPGQIPLLMGTVSASVNSGEGFSPVDSSVSLYRDHCDSHNCAKTRTQNFYDWDFGQTAVWNKDHNNFAAKMKKVSYGDEDLSGDETTQCTHYTRQTDGDNWILEKPKAAWVQDGAGGDCPLDINSGPTKYEFKQFYYDGRNTVPGSLPAANPKGLLTKAETIETDSGETIAALKDYDEYGNVTKQTDAKGNSSYTRYYSGGIYPKETENALGHKTQTDYDFTLGIPTKMTDPNGAVTQYAYDALGRLTKVAKPGDSLSSPTSQFTYYINNSSRNSPLAVNKKIKVNDSNDILESYDFFNGIGQKFQTQSREPDGTALTNTSEVNSVGETVVSYLPFKHDNFGKAVQAPGGTGKSQIDYDIRGRAWKSTTPDGRVTKNLFREADFLSASVDSENRVVVNKQEGRVSKTISCKEKNGQICSEGGGLLTTSYQDVLGNTTKVIDSQGMVVTENSYDTLGRKKWTEDADLGRYGYVYDKNGNLERQKDPLGNVVTFEYDSLDRTERKKFNGEIKISYSYDSCSYGKGRMCIVEDNYQKTEYSYDQRGRLDSVSKSFAGKELENLFGRNEFVTNYQYDNTGRQVAVTYPKTDAFGEETVKFDYDGVYLKSAKGNDTYVSDISYNTFGQVEKRLLGNSVEERFDYNVLNQRLTHIGIYGSEDILDLDYDNYSPAGNILSIKDNLYDAGKELSMDQDFTYDNFYRLTGASGAYEAEFRYDDLDRMKYKKEGPNEHSYTFNSVFPYHGVKSVNGAQINYDSKGEILSYDIDGLRRELEWDHSIGKPTKITVHPPDGDTVTVNFYYDGEGNRLAKKVDGANYTLYINSRLEKAVAKGETMWRKNYTAGGKLVAVRNVGGGSVEIDADVNDDGEITMADVQEVLNNYKPDPDNPRADVNGDGVVNGIDVGTVIMSLVE